MNKFTEETTAQDPFGEEVLLINLQDFKTWIIHEDEDLIVINKPGWVVCHPSKNGPFSSLVGASREYTGLERLHLISRLDRETSGIVILAKNKKTARICQMALEYRFVNKFYFVLLIGELNEKIHVDQPLAKDINSPVHAKQCVRQDRTAQPAQTTFNPLLVKNGFTFAETQLHTGRKHQIRAHAQWLGYPVVGDKIYGSDDTLFLEFIEKGWTSRLADALPLKRQALHAARLEFIDDAFKASFSAPLPTDMQEFCQNYMEFDPSIIEDKCLWVNI